MGCSPKCHCHKGIVALVLVPGIMGTRLKNRKSGKSVWDPAAGKGFSGPSSEAGEVKVARELEMANAQPEADDSVWEGMGKWVQRRIIGLKRRGDNMKEAGRLYRTKAAMVPRITDFLWASPTQRKALLVNEKAIEGGAPIFEAQEDLLKVDEGSDDYFRVYTSIPKFQVAEKRQRGWGEVHWDSYGPMLRYLQSQQPDLKRHYPGLEFPVFAIGYNWMQSNEKAGQRIKDRLRQFRQQLLEWDELYGEQRLTASDIRFVLITHSMGGYAARAGSLFHGLEDDKEVVGIIHGAMPTHGSPDVYKQFRCGAAGASKLVLGKNAADITAVLGYSQGGLELLPNQLYVDADNQPKWLYVNPDPGHDPAKRQVLEVGYGARMFEFYRQFDHWYSMVQPPLLAPELRGASASQLTMFTDAFEARIEKCETFHQQLADEFHPTTVLIYSHNPDTPALDRCEWQADAPLPAAMLAEPAERWQCRSVDNTSWFWGQGDIRLSSQSDAKQYDARLREWTEIAKRSYSAYHVPPPPSLPDAAPFALAGPTAPGDGTVHLGAGKYPQGVEIIGVDARRTHQEFYHCPEVCREVMTVVKNWLPCIHKLIRDSG